MAEGISFPLAFVTRMREQLQQSWPSFAEAHLQPSPISIRINPEKSKPRDLEKILWSDFGYYLPQRPSFTFDPTFHGGAYYVQEASSMFLEQAIKQSVDLTQPLTVLDLCAAPGGKSTHLLSLLSPQSLLVANEAIRSRATILAENLQKWGFGNAVVTNNDPEDFQKLEGFFDIILVDAPCSGEGLFRKDKDAMNEWSLENAELCSLRQQRIVNQVWPSLKKDGILIYCTCTYNKKENEENIKWLLKEKKAESLKLDLENNWGVEEIKEEDIFGYRFYPHKTNGEGFFLSVIRKHEEQHEIQPHSKNLFSSPNKKIIERLTDWFTHPDETAFASHEELIIGIPRNSIYEISLLAKALKVIQKGTAVATVKHDKLIPEHAFALSILCNRQNFPSVTLSYDQAIAYLRKDLLNPETDAKGFALMCYEGTSLGWGNLLGNRMNNLYPSPWRIRNEFDHSTQG
ncbi:MAG: rRNA methyltransferase [Bacteroidetes bacterium]|nr:rRNA methyltransferase [Bacteroidota bacterium]